MAAARHASRGDEKRGDQAAVSPLRLIVETRKRGDLEPGLAGGEHALLVGFHRGSRAGGAGVARGTSRCDGRTRADANSRRAPTLRAR
jgi:hypothetical protein